MSQDKKKNSWLKSGIYTLLERVSSLLFGVGSFFILVRALSKEDFGTWALFLSVTALVEVSRNGLIQNAQVKFLTSTPVSEHPKIISASTVLNAALTLFSILLIAAAAGVFAFFWKSPALESMLYIYIATTILLIPFSQFNFIQQANFDFKGIFWSNLCRQGGLFTYIVYAFFTDLPLSLVALSIVQAAAAMGGAVVAFAFAKKYFSWSSTLDWLWVKKLFHFGKYVCGTNVSSMLFKGMDQMMLASFLGTSSVAVYNTAVRVSNMVEVPTTSIATIVFPQSAKRVATEGVGAAKELYEKSVGLIFALVLPAALFILVFPELIVWLVAGSSYSNTAPILQVTILYSLFIPFLRQFGTVLDSIGKPKVNFYFIVFCAFLNFIFNYIFISWLGTIGAAYGTLSSYAVIFVLNQIILYRELNIKTFRVFFNIKESYVKGFQLVVFYYKKYKKKKKVSPKL